jgi:hypothetical protein
MHPSNRSLSHILKAAMKLSSSETVEIIQGELALFSMFVDAETNSYWQRINVDSLFRANL